MKRLFDDLAAQFDLEQRVRGVALGDLVERLELDLDEGPEWGTPGNAEAYETVTHGPVDVHYVPHLFPGMDPKLRLAHRLQYRLLPTEVPAAAPMSIAAVLESYCHLSGDLFGWEMRSDGDFLIWILDLSGHGLETGLAAAVLKAMIDQFHDQGEVAEFVGQLNEAMNRSLRPGSRPLFATGFFMTLSADGDVKFCSAGHPPALISGPRTALRELARNSRPIGLFPNQTYVADAARLDPGETLFLYTDGLVELTTSSGDPLGLGAIRDFLQASPREPKRLTDSLYRTISRQRDMKLLEDDVTFVAARMLGN